MLIIGLDYHPGFQQIAFVDSETGELQERRLQHREEAEKFYRDNPPALSAGWPWRAGRVAIDFPLSRARRRESYPGPYLGLCLQTPR